MAGVKLQRQRRYRREILLRTLAAVPLNYAITTALTMLLARLLPGGPLQGAIGATLLSFAIFAAIARAAFAVRSVPKLWLALVVAGAVAAIADALLIHSGGRL